MANRSTRRAEISRFKRDLSDGALLSYLIEPDDARLADAPLLRAAIWHWRSNVARRRPFCCACKRSFVDEVQPGAFLLGVPVGRSSAASVSAFCIECWSDMDDDALRREAARVHGLVLANARFADT